MNTTANFDHRSVLKGTAYLMIGNIIGQAIGLAGLLLLSRIYGPSGMGQWALFVGIGFMVPVLAGLRYDISVIIVEEDSEARQLALLAVGVSCISALLALVLAALIYATDFKYVPLSWRITAFAYSLYILTNGFINAATSWAIRKKHYIWLMLMRVGQPLATLVLQYLFQDSKSFGNGLILGTVLGCLVIAIWSVFLLYHPIRQALQEARVVEKLRKLAWRERNFPFFSVTYMVLSYCANQVIAVALALWYSVTVAGYFNMAYRTLYAPLMLIGTALGQAIMPSLAEAKKNIARFEEIITAILRILGWVYLPPLVFIILRGPELYSFVFGASWAQAGIYAGYLTMALYGLALTVWLEKIFDILGRQKLHLLVSLVLNGMCVLLYALAHFFFKDASSTAFAWSMGMLLYSAIWLGIVFRICGFSLSRLLYLGMEFSILALLIYNLANFALQMNTWAEQIAGIAAVFVMYGLGAWLMLRGSINQLIQDRVILPEKTSPVIHNG